MDMPVASPPTVVTPLHWLVTVVASAFALAGGWSFAQHAPRHTPLSIVGQLLPLAAFVYLTFFAGVPIYFGLAALVLNTLGNFLGLWTRRKKHIEGGQGPFTD